MSVGGWFAYWFGTVPFLALSAAYLMAEDGCANGFSKWWFRVLCCLSLFLVCFGAIRAVMGW